MGERQNSRAAVRFALISTQRSGTSWLIERLVQHPDVVAYGELFLSRQGVPTWPLGSTDLPFFPSFSRHGASRFRPLVTFNYLDRVYRRRASSRVVGFKLMYDEARRYPEIWPYLVYRRVRLVHLIRRNLLDLALSRLAMPLRERVHVRGDENVEPIRFRIDAEELLKVLRKLERNHDIATRLVGASPIPTFTLAYEDMLENDFEFSRLLDFLDLSAPWQTALDSDMKRLTSGGPHSEIIENFEEVRAALAQSPFGRFVRG